MRKSLNTVAVLLVCAAGTLASADVILGNLPGTGSGTGTNLGLGTDGADRTKGVGLTMGGDSMLFVSMVALLSNAGTTNANASGGIYSSVGNNPGVLLAAFTPVTVAAGSSAAEYALTTASDFTLDAGTSYWFVLDGPGTTNSLLWQSLTPNTVPTGSVAFVGYRFSSNGGSTWGSSSIYNGMNINAVIPAPGALALLGLGALAARRRR